MLSYGVGEYGAGGKNQLLHLRILIPIRCCFAQNFIFHPLLRIRICKIHMFLGLPDPVRLVQGTDPYPTLDTVPYITKQK